MKKLLYSSLILGSAFALASCSADEPTVTAGDGRVTISVSLPEMATRALGDDPVCNELYYSVFSESGVEIYKNVAQSAFTDNPTSTEVTLTLVPGEKYKVAFYAHNSSSEFSSFDNGVISVDYSQIHPNQEIDDAFYYYGTLEPTLGSNLSVTLNRAFAQLNIGTSDIDLAVVQTALPHLSYKLNISKGIYTSFDMRAAENQFSGNGSITDFTAPVPNKNSDFTIANISSIASIYLLTTEDSSSLLEGSFCPYNTHDDVTTAMRDPIDLANVPVMMNYRTNVYGQLLSSNFPVTVRIEPDFIGNAGTVTVGWDGKTDIDLSKGDMTIIGGVIPAGLNVSGSGNLTLIDTSIAPGADNTPALTLADGTKVNLTLKNSSLTGSKNGDGIRVPQTAELYLTGKNITLIGNAAKEYISLVNKTEVYSNTTDTSFANTGGSGIGNAGQPTGKITIDKAENLVAEAYGLHAFGIGGTDTDVTITNSSITYARGGFAQPLCVDNPEHGKSEPEGGAAIGVAGTGTVTLASTTVAKADGGSKAAAIGTSYWANATVNITDCTLTHITGGNASAAIGGSRVPDDKNHVEINIADSNIECKGGMYGAGIGSGYKTYCFEVDYIICTIHISGNSKIAAVGGQYGAGIGTGYHVASLAGYIDTGVDTSGTKAGSPDFKKAGYTTAQNIGYGVCDPAREFSDKVEVTFTVDGKVIPDPRTLMQSSN